MRRGNSGAELVLTIGIVAGFVSVVLSAAYQSQWFGYPAIAIGLAILLYSALNSSSKL